MSPSKNKVIPIKKHLEVTQRDILEEIEIRETLLKKRNYIRRILEASGKVERGPHSAKLVRASWAVGGKTLVIR